jgi:hypothetical protein
MHLVMNNNDRGESPTSYLNGGAFSRGVTDYPYIRENLSGNSTCREVLLIFDVSLSSRDH